MYKAFKCNVAPSISDLISFTFCSNDYAVIMVSISELKVGYFPWTYITNSSNSDSRGHKNST